MCYRKSIELVSSCYKENEEWTEIILTDRVEILNGRSTCLELAVETKQEEFVAHPAIQGLLDEVWYGSIEKNTPYWLVRKGPGDTLPEK